jgi:nucleoside-diphosphate-sugar epimerase
MPSTLNDPAPATVLVTGIGGFLGGHIARQLLAAGYRVRGSVRSTGVCDRIRRQLVPIRRPKRSALSRRIFAPMPDGMSR